MTPHRFSTKAGPASRIGAAPAHDGTNTTRIRVCGSRPCLGVEFTFWGAGNQGLPCPGRYSHSPAEVLGLRDLDALTRLILAVASARES
jgi:hypothetical protein